MAPDTILWPGVFVPFTALIQFTPITGICDTNPTESSEQKGDEGASWSITSHVLLTRTNRTARYRDMQKAASVLENTLSTSCDSYGLQMDIVRPISFTPQFGQYPARFTVNGHVGVMNSFINEPVLPVTVDSSNKEITGYNANNASNTVPSTTLDAVCVALKSFIEISTQLTVYQLRVAGHIYGYKGTTFP